MMNMLPATEKGSHVTCSWYLCPFNAYLFLVVHVSLDTNGKCVYCLGDKCALSLFYTYGTLLLSTLDP